MYCNGMIHFYTFKVVLSKNKMAFRMKNVINGHGHHSSLEYRQLQFYMREAVVEEFFFHLILFPWMYFSK